MSGTTTNPLYSREFPEHEKLRWADRTQMIWYSKESVYWELPQNSYCYFRRSFTLPQGIVSSAVRLFADSRYMFLINGVYVGRGPCRSDPRYQYYDVWDITPHLREGENAIAILALYFGYGTGQSMSRQPVLVLEGSFTAENGEVVGLSSDTSWKAAGAEAYSRNTPRINGRQGSVECCDARVAPEGWTEIGYDDSAWEQAVGRSINGFKPYWNLVPRSIPFLTESEIQAVRYKRLAQIESIPEPLDRIHRQLIREIQSFTVDDRQQDAAIPAEGLKLPPTPRGHASVVLFDFMRVEAGHLQLVVTGASGTILDIAYAEDLWENKVWLEEKNRPIDRFILNEGTNVLEVAFGWKAFRYAQVTVRDADRPVTIRRFGMRTRGYPLEKRGSFFVDDPELMKIREISEHTLQLCMQDGFLDSSSREQQQWMGDGRLQAIMNYYVSGDGRLHRKLLEQNGQSQDWSGLTRARHPDDHNNLSPIPPFCLAWISSFADYSLYTADDTLIAPWWPNIVHALRWFSAYENEHGLLENVPHWIYIDWAEWPDGPMLDTDRGGIVTALNLQYLEALRVAARFAEQLGNAEAKQIFSSRAQRIETAVQQYLWDEARGAYVDCMVDGVFSDSISEPTNALAVLHLHEPADERSSAMMDNVFSAQVRDKVTICGPYFMMFICRALTKLGYPERAMAMIRERYRVMLDAGSTTTWEMWKLFHVGAGGKFRILSASHAWGASPIVFYAESVLGIRPIEPGFRRFTIQPRLCGLAHAEGAVPTPHGDIAVRITRIGERLNAAVTVPQGCVGVAEGRELPEGHHEMVLAEGRGGDRQCCQLKHEANPCSAAQTPCHENSLGRVSGGFLPCRYPEHRDGP